MTLDEANKVINGLKAEGHSEEEILGAFYKMFQNDEIDINGLEGLVEAMGWHLTEEFKAMSPEDQKTKGYEEIEDGEETPKAVEEAAKEHPSNEDEVSDKNPQAEGNAPASESKEEDEDEEKAMKMFGLNKK